MELPPTYNVVGGLKLEMAPIPIFNSDSDQNPKTINLPIMVMEQMNGALRDWIGNEKFGMEDRLFALAQAFNGLLFLYSSGIEGHGDLKPENLLYMNMKEGFAVEEDHWLFNHPWVIKVADLGWADAWVDYGYTDKAFRPYLAPERVKQGDEPGKFIPEKSDIFSMGIIAAELLQGEHPAKNLKKATKSNRNWFRWAKNHEPDLSGIVSTRMSELIYCCLHPDHEKRPSAADCFDIICKELQEANNLDVAPTLELWRQDISKELGISEEEHAVNAALRSIDLGGDQENIAREKLENLTDKIQVTNLKTCTAWTTAASALVYIYEQKSNSDVKSKIVKLRESGSRYLEIIFSDLSKVQLDAFPSPNFGTKFEWLATTLKNLAYVANITYDDIANDSFCISNLALSALAYSTASSIRSGNQGSKPFEHYLDEAIRLAPNEATPLYFRAFWGHCSHWLNLRCSPNKETVKRWIKDLETACILAPDWNEPKTLINKLVDELGSLENQE